MPPYLLTLCNLLLLFALQALGTQTVQSLNWNFPGVIVGMGYFFCLQLLLKKTLLKKIERTTSFFNSHLSLFFIPAGAGLIKHYPLLLRSGLPLLLTLFLSTVITLLATALIFKKMLQWTGHE